MVLGGFPDSILYCTPFQNLAQESWYIQGPLYFSVGCTDRWLVYMTSLSYGAHDPSKQLPSSFLCPRAVRGLSAVRGNVLYVEHNTMSPVSLSGLRHCGVAHGESPRQSASCSCLCSRQAAATVNTAGPAKHRNSHSGGC